MPEASNLQREMFSFEEAWTPDRGQKATEVRARFGLDLTSYYEELARAAAQPWASTEFPGLAGWLRRLEAQRSKFRPRVPETVSPSQFR